MMETSSKKETNTMKILEQLTMYNPDEFFPVYREGQLDNRAEFVAYKAEQFAGALGRVAHRTLEVAATAGTVLLDHIAD